MAGTGCVTLCIAKWHERCSLSGQTPAMMPFRWLATLFDRVESRFHRALTKNDRSNHDSDYAELPPQIAGAHPSRGHPRSRVSERGDLAGRRDQRLTHLHAGPYSLRG